MVDHQEGLYQIARDIPAVDMKANILAHAALGKIFNLPTVLTTSADSGKESVFSILRCDAEPATGQNGPLPQEIIAMHPNAPFIHRQGEVDAWDNAEFRAAVQATGKKQIILAGITTDVRRLSTFTIIL